MALKNNMNAVNSWLLHIQLIYNNLGNDKLHMAIKGYWYCEHELCILSNFLIIKEEK